MAVNDTHIRTAKPAKKQVNGDTVATPRKLADGKGLYLEVRPTGAKLWRYRYRIDGKENVYAMGEYFNDPQTPGHMSLDAARTERARCRALVKQGIHPLSQRREQKAQGAADRANTFQSVATQWIERERKHWSADYADSVQRTLELHVYPKIGSKPVRAVNTREFRGLLEALEQKAVTAINVRQWCSAIFTYAILTDRADIDPTAPLKGHVKRPDVQHKTPLTKDGIAALVQKIEVGGYMTTRIALKLLLLLFVRPGELRRAEWSEFDLERAVWTIPAEKMKKRAVHVVPLPTQAVELLKALQTITGGRRYVFPNQRNPVECMGENTLNAALRSLGYRGQFSAHGFRATASTELHELGYRSDLIEFQLAHAERDQTKASYNQAQFMTERRQMMQQWANMVDAWSKGANVVSIKAKIA
jgi:integrase